MLHRFKIWRLQMANDRARAAYRKRGGLVLMAAYAKANSALYAAKYGRIAL